MDSAVKDRESVRKEMRWELSRAACNPPGNWGFGSG